MRASEVEQLESDVRTLWAFYFAVVDREEKRARYLKYPQYAGDKLRAADRAGEEVDRLLPEVEKIAGRNRR